MEKFTNFPKSRTSFNSSAKPQLDLSVTSKRQRSQQSSSASAICKTIHKHKVPATKTQKGSRELQFANNSNNNFATKTCSHKTCEVLQRTNMHHHHHHHKNPQKLIYGNIICCLQNKQLQQTTNATKLLKLILLFTKQQQQQCTTTKPHKPEKKKELNLLDAKMRASADMKNKTAHNIIYKTF